jgi:predicted MFS family arabinose efflux permease
MDVESALIPVREAPAVPRTPLHLRYLSLLRRNRNFRHLWMAQLVSELGDWFYSLAVYDLLLKTTQSGQAVSWAIIIQLLPWFFMTPIAGFLADRFPRRRLMIAADLVQGFVVLGLFLVRSASDIWLVYVLLGVEVIFASIFEPARSALLPNLAQPEELLAANALSSATWSFALMVGAALGGVVAALLGRQVAFVLNSVSFFASALLLQRIQCAESHVQAAGRPASGASGSAGVRSLREGCEYLRQNPKVTVLVLAKTGLGCAGGGFLLLAVFGERIFPIGSHGALAMGLLYGAAGAGAGIGPLLGEHLTRGIQSRMWKSISLSLLVTGASYFALSHAPSLPLAALAVFCAHAGGSNVWVVSTSLLQLNVADRFRGRVFAVDFGLNVLAASGSNYIMGIGLDTWSLSARQLAAGLGAVLMIPSLLWLPAQATWAKEAESLNP